jgi:hypothetical protein
MALKRPVKGMEEFENIIFYQRLTGFIHGVEATDGRYYETIR